MATKLYSYQEQALSTVLDHLSNNQTALIVKASGLGKTILSAELVKYFLNEGLKGLFITDKYYPIEQALSVYDQELDADLGIYTGALKSLDFEQSDVLFTSFQILARSKNRRQFLCDKFDFIIVDEAHHATAATYKKVLDYFTPKYLIGMTATPDRRDDKDIRLLFGDEVVSITIADALANDWLTPVDYRVMNDGLHIQQLRKILRQVYEEGEKFSILQLNETIFIKERDEAIAEKILSHDMKTIIFCENILHAENFRKYIPGGRVLHSQISKRKRDIALKNFREDKIQYLLVVDMLNEGIDIPNTEMVVFLRCTDSPIIFQQQLGRGLRLYPNKDKVLVLDFVANVDRLVAVKTLAEEISRKKGLFKEGLDPTPTYISGLNYNFEFSEEIIDVIKLIIYLTKKTYISDVPYLTDEYMSPPKNKLLADQVIAGTNKTLWWKCSNLDCGHEWQTRGSNRCAPNNTGCPACLGRVPTNKNNLAVTHPELAKEYMPPPKNKLPADQILATTHKKLWWRCSNPDCGYEWQTTGDKRTIEGTGCPACSGRVPTDKNNLAVTHPGLAKEYMPPPKNKLPANQVFAGTGKKLWWQCPTCGHEWQAVGVSRTRGNSCPACANKVVTDKNNLAATHPDLAKEYMPPPKNKLPANKVYGGSYKKFWWQCPTCGHEWQAVGSSRIHQGTGCPACYERKRAKKVPKIK